MKKKIAYLLLILVLLSSCSGSLLDNLEEFTSAMNTNVFIKNKLNITEKNTLSEALTVQSLPLDNNGWLKTQSRKISVLDGSKIDIILRYSQSLDGDTINILETIPNDVRTNLSIIFNNRAKGDDIKAYLSTSLEGVTHGTINECAQSIIRVLDHSIAKINFPSTAEGGKVKQAVDDVIAEVKKVINSQFNALTKGDVLAISVLSSSINNIISKVGAQAIALGDYQNEEFEVFNFNWNKIFESNSDKYFLALIDSLVEELAMLNAILPYCGSFINFDIKAIANNFLGGM